MKKRFLYVKSLLLFSIIISPSYWEEANCLAQANRIWASYYGGMGDDFGHYVATDVSGNVYMAGQTSSATGIASAGFQNAFSGGVNADGFLVKFDGAGNRLWATYYGGSGGEWVNSVTTDISGNVYLAGFTESTSIASGGFQNVFGGGAYDAFLVKFDPSGNRLWATYYGGTGIDWGYGIAADASGNNVYLSGLTNSSGLSSAGFQNSLSGGNEAFLVKFDANSGNRLWATYYGGTGSEYGYNVNADVSGNVYLTGVTTSASGIASAGFQNIPGGNNDAFLVKFDGTNGSRLWATYYGGTGIDYGYSISSGSSNNIYLAGQTNSPTGMASGGFQNASGGGEDAFLVKFDGATGNRLWATYYGGTGTEEGYSVAIDNSGIYLAGDSYSPTNIASTGFQNTLIGAENLFVAKFDTTGNRLCATYYGAAHDEKAKVALDPLNGDVYLSGYTPSSSGIASPGGFQNSWGGGVYDAFLVKLSSCATALTTSITSTNILCKNECIGTATASPTGGTSPYTYSWTTVPLQTTANATGLCADTYTLTISDANGTTTTATITITEPPTIITASVSNTVNVLCNGQCTGTATVSANGGTSTYTYLWNTLPAQSSNIATGLCQGTYIATTTDANGCTSTQTVNITEPTPLTSSVTNTPATCNNNNGSATVNANGGNPGYTYLWNTTPVQATITATGIAAGNYSVTITDGNNCTTTATVAVTNSNGPTASVSSQTNVLCYGTNTGSATIIANNGISPYTYLWLPSGGTDSTASNLISGNYTVTITDANGCTYSQTINITEPAALTYSLSPGICSGKTYTLPDGTIVNSSGTYTTTLTSVNGCDSVITTTLTVVSAFNTNQSASICPGSSYTLPGGTVVNTAGTYTNTITTSGGCDSIITTILTVNPLSGSNQFPIICSGKNHTLPDGTIVNAGGSYTTTLTAASATGCDSIVITTLTVNPVSTSSQSPSICTGNTYALPDGTIVNASGTYISTLTSANGCDSIITTTLMVNLLPTITITMSPNVAITLGTLTTLTASGGGNYQWTTADTTSIISVSPIQTTTYCVTVTNNNGCTSIACVTIVVDIECGELYLPNAFSPNEDQENDGFCLQGGIGMEYCIKDLHIIIYDRWGERVYESENKNFCWDGTYKDNPQNSAVFVYYLNATLSSGEKITKQGNVSLIR